MNRDELVDEREFLLKSLDDLESERADGNIDDDTYKLLHDDYTARAAAVIRTLADGEEHPVPEPARARTGMRIATITGVIVFALVAAYGLSQAVGQRRPGQTPTGNSQLDDGASLAAAVKKTPKSYEAHLAYARYLFANGDGPGALEQFFAAEKLDPKQAEPMAYVGWLSASQSLQTTNPNLQKTLLQLAHDSLDRAIAVNPKYPDAYAFKGFVLDRIDQQPAAAAQMFAKFLALAPRDHPLRAQVLQVLAADQAAPPTTKP